MFKTSKGQALLLDLTFAFFLFLIAWSMLTSEFDKQLKTSQDFASVQEMKVKADYVLEGLVKNSGTPQNWESLQIADVNSIGLATKDREISEKKLAAFSNFTAQYSTLKNILGFEEYDFFFSFDGIDDSNAGLLPGGGANEVNAQRIVTFKGGVATAKITVYKLPE